MIWRPNPQKVEQLRGSLDFVEQYIFAKKTSEKLRHLLDINYVSALGAVTGNQAIQMVKSGLKSIYLSGWQTAADNNDSDQMYPDIGLYNTDSVPKVIKKINNSLKRCAQIYKSEEKNNDWLCPIVADGEHGFGGILKSFELAKAMITEGVAGIHLENQAVSHERKCGHLSGKVLVPSLEYINKLKAIRLAAEICGVNTVIIARTDAKSAQFITSNIDERDQPFITGERSKEGLYKITGGINMAISNGLSFAPYADLLWMEDSTPSLDNAIQFAEAIHSKYPNKMLALNCSPSFNWKKFLSEKEMLSFQEDLSKFGYRYFFITLAGFHSLNTSMFELAKNYQKESMLAYSKLQEREFQLQFEGFTAIKHQNFVGSNYFDKVLEEIDKDTSTQSMKGSTEEQQFHD